MEPDPKTPLDYAVPTKRLKWRRGYIFAIGITAVILLIVATLFVPTAHPPRQAANVIKCESNLREIYQGLKIHADSHGGNFPNRMEEIVLSADIDTWAFVCPSSAETQTAPGASADQTLANLYAAPGHCSIHLRRRGPHDFGT